MYWMALGSVCVVLLGCATGQNYKSAEFSGDKIYKRVGATSPQLRENEVLGVKSGDGVSDEEIRKILDEGGSLRLKPGSKVLVVQSGVTHPDNAMVQELSRHFAVLPHTGMPSDLKQGDGQTAVSKNLRLAAAHSSAETILVYWGHLEMKRDDLPTSLVSWVPVIDFTVPDEYQKVRMFLKMALVDVRTGHWATFRTEAIEDEALTTRYARERDKTWSLDRTKQKLYHTAVKKLTDGYLASAR
jgi:hypothetical protein